MNERAYAVTIKKDAVKSLARLAPQYQRRVAGVMRSLAFTPRPAGSLRLKGSLNTWRVRVGDVRILYDIDDDLLTVDIVRIAHRSDAYRNL